MKNLLVVLCFIGAGLLHYHYSHKPSYRRQFSTAPSKCEFRAGRGNMREYLFTGLVRPIHRYPRSNPKTLFYRVTVFERRDTWIRRRGYLKCDYRVLFMRLNGKPGI